MAKVTLGSTGICVEQMAFGALPVQRDDMDTAISLLREAYNGGMRFFDTARAYSDSEEKLGRAFAPLNIRSSIYIATKCYGTTPQEFWEQLNTSLSLLQTDYVDIYQFHNPKQCYRPGDGSGMYECMLEAKQLGKIRHIGFTNHSIDLAEECISSGLYETLQFPFSYLSTERELALAEKCAAANMGFIAMKALAGGLINNARAAAAFITGYKNVLPIWGIQRDNELQELLGYIAQPPCMTDELLQVIKKDRAELTGGFCRSCGYCMPCPAGIEINQCARMSQLIRRSPSEQYLEPVWQEKMLKIKNCTGCGRCKSKCPYKLDTPELLKANLADYLNILSGKTSIS